MTAERTERFEPPMWEEIGKDYSFYFYIKDISYVFYVNKYIGCIEITRDNMHNMLLNKDKEVTKENYIKACEIVRDLFNKGGAK
jgi:hypothetical protein